MHRAGGGGMSAPVPSALVEVAGFLLNQLAQRIREETEQALIPLGIRPRQVGLLLALRDDGPQSQQTLGARLNMDRTTTMQLVDALERQGVVVRQADPGDRRAYRVALTAAGRRTLRAVERDVRAVEADVLSGLSAAERRNLNRLLRLALERRQPRKGQPPEVKSEK
jgi:DNA-binding MarR family transcriptional regulator